MHTLIGSKAIKYHFSDFRVPMDTDYVTDERRKHELKEGKRIEYFYYGDNEALLEFDRPIPTVDQLYTLKVSHSFWPINWRKHMKDILFLQEKGAKLDKELFDKLYDGWVGYHGKKRAYLNVDNEKFFTSTVPREYVHDDIHKAISYYGDPLYNKVKRDVSKALISEKMFNELSHIDQIRLCREEIYATALERFLIKKLPGLVTENDISMAYGRACMLLVTSMTKGFFPLFIVLNWKELHRPDDHPFLIKFLIGVQNGTVKRTKENHRRLAETASRAK